MSESPIQLRGKSGGVVFQGTQSPGGGSQPGAPVVRGPFAFAFNTPGLADGVAFYTPTVDDVLLELWVEIDTAWDGTTPKGDVGSDLADTNGALFGGVVAPLNMMIQDGDLQHLMTNGLLSLLVAGGLNATNLQTGGRRAPGRFLTADPLKVWVSQDGLAGSAAPGASQGAARIYLVTATPAAFA